MLLKLIKEAQLLSTMEQAELTAYKQIQAATGKSLTQLAEAYVPSEQEYKTWLDVLTGVAEEKGVSLARKSDFAELLGMVWENDPNPPPFSMQSALTNKMWALYQAKKHDDKISQLGSQQSTGGIVGVENEESGFAQAFKAAQGVEDEQATPRSFAQYVKATPADSASASQPDADVSDDGEPSVEDIVASILKGDGADSDTEADACPDCGHDLPDCPKCGESMHCDACGYGQDDAHSHDDDADPEADGDVDPEADPDSDHPPPANDDHGLQDGDEYPEDDEHLNISISAKPNVQDEETVMPHFEDEEQVEYSEEEAVKNLFRHAATSPKEHMNTVMKELESEGASAWMGLRIPKNPHPTKTPAHKAWMKGFLNAAKQSLGIVDKPTVTSKQKLKKR